MLLKVAIVPTPLLDPFVVPFVPPPASVTTTPLETITFLILLFPPSVTYISPFASNNIPLDPCVGFVKVKI